METVLVLYCLFNELLLREAPMENFEKTRKMYDQELKRPSIESAVMHLLIGILPHWPLVEHREVHDSYFRDKGKANTLKLPAAFETGMSLELAERYRFGGDVSDAQHLVVFAAENYPPLVSLQLLEKEFDPEEAIDWRDAVLQATTKTDVGNDNV